MNAVLVRKDASPKEYREAVEKAKKAWSDHGKRPAWGCKWYDVSFLQEALPCSCVPSVLVGVEMKHKNFEVQLRCGSTTWKREWIQDRNR